MKKDVIFMKMLLQNFFQLIAIEQYCQLACGISNSRVEHYLQLRAAVSHSWL